MNKINLPKTIPVFPLSNFIIFPKTTVPLNIFEPRYIEMINDSMKSNKLIGLIQPKKSVDDQFLPILHGIGCLGKITSFRETEDGRYMIEIRGLIRFETIKEVKSSKPVKSVILAQWTLIFKCFTLRMFSVFTFPSIASS